MYVVKRNFNIMQKVVERTERVCLVEAGGSHVHFLKQLEEKLLLPRGTECLTEVSQPGPRMIIYSSVNLSAIAVSG